LHRVEYQNTRRAMKMRLSENHYTGCLLGGAIGDALGAPVEFMELDGIRLQYGPQGITDYVEYPGRIGEFTDDTQMTLFTAEGLLRANHRAVLKGIGGATIPITYQSYLRWLHTQGSSAQSVPDGWGVWDIEKGWLINEPSLFRSRAPGNTCLDALMAGLPGTIERPINTSKGCGGIMRMAPVGLLFDNPRSAFDIGCQLAALTHGHPSGYLSAGVFAVIIQQLTAGVDLESAITGSLAHLCAPPGHEETLHAITGAVNLFHQTTAGVETGTLNLADQIGKLGRGWVGEEALAISLFCSLHHEHDFRSGVLASVNHSGDSDSTGSITGNILGLINGIESIPDKWISNLRSARIVLQVGKDLHTGCKGNTDEPDEEWWGKYPGY
jgi:ADP-ribosylglycohydrolase